MRILLLLQLLISTTLLTAQVDSLDAGLVRLLEEYIEFNELGEDFDFNTLFDNLVEFRSQPLDINKATEQDLRDIILINDVQINNFLSYRANYGPFMDILELQAVPGFDLSTIKALRPFISTKGSTTTVRKRLADRLKAGKSVLFLKWRRVLEERKGFQDRLDPNSGEQSPAPFAGRPDYLYTRYRFSAGRGLSFGFTLENDPGEPFFEGINRRTGFDYQSLFIYAEDLSDRLKAVALGDYTISFGQGLILHNGFGAGKSSLVMNLKKGGNTIRPYSSVNEFNFFRGGAATIQMSKTIDLTVFASYKKIDGTIDTIGLLDDEIFTSFTIDGLHRTENEISKKNNITQFNTGFTIAYRNNKNLKVGLNYLFNQFDTPLQRNVQLYNQFRFDGTHLSNASIDYSYRFQNFNFFGESAISENGGTANLHGVLATLDRHVDFSLLYRNFSRDYQVLNPNAFGESTLPINEEGIYFGSIIRPFPSWTISAYADLFRFPWLRFRADAPYQGSEYLVRLEYYKKRRFTAYLQYRWEQKAINTNIEGNPIDKLAKTMQQRIRLHASNKISKEIELRNRVEWSIFQQEKTTYGFLIYQDIVYKPIASRFSLSARYSLFDIDRFDNRIYAFENDILYEFRIPFFVNQGQRYYANLRFKATRNWTLEFRFARTILTGAEDTVLLSDLNFSSGNNLIQGNRFTEVKAQARYTF